MSSCDDCANLCASFVTCLSYECSSTALKCNLNAQADPSRGAYLDYAFCTKMGTNLAGCPHNFDVCTSENGATCTFSGTRRVAYGEQDTWVFQTASESIECNNNVFGDPLPGVRKKCCIDSGLSYSALTAEPNAEFAYIGCYADTSARALPAYRGNEFELDSCLAACSDFPYFGLQYNGQCWCGESFANAVQYGESDACPQSGLGGTWANNLYTNLMALDFITPPTNKNVWVIDLSSFPSPSANICVTSLFVLLLVLAVCAVYQKCHSSKRAAYAKVQMHEILTDEDQALNA